ncbi:MAG: hypothetical protein P1S60_18680, partial [Anaerolineae bacterium]|nr:hypothetical protein [Anaerolineae bacterium]
SEERRFPMRTLSEERRFPMRTLSEERRFPMRTLSEERRFPMREFLDYSANGYHDLVSVYGDRTNIHKGD